MFHIFAHLHYSKRVPGFFHYAKSHELFFMQNGTKVTYKKGQFIVRPEDESPWIYFLHQGAVKVSVAYSSGDERIIGFFIAGMTFAQSGSFFKNEPDGLEYVAMQPTVTYRVLQRDFLAALASNLQVANDHIAALSKNQLFLIELIMCHGESTAQRKLLRWLLLMAKYYCLKDDCTPVRVCLPLTQDTIAGMLHLTRESVSKGMRELIRKKIVYIEAKCIVINSVAVVKQHLYE